jgi:lantibiotic biosynthesis dehydratase-like protein
MRVPIEDSLYVIVPRINSGQRGAILDIRRAVHNGRFCSPAAEVRAALRAVSEDADQLLGLWLTEAQRAVEALAQAELCLEKEVNDITRRGLWTVAQQPEFLRALAHASPDLARSLSREPPKPRGVRSNKIERSLLAYLIRAAAKTSPFGLFMHQAVFAVDPEGKSDCVVIDPSERSSHSYLNPGLGTFLQGGAYGCCGKPDHSTYIVNPTLTWSVDNVGTAVVAPLIVVGGRVWRSERQVAVRLHARVVEVLRDLLGEF